MYYLYGVAMIRLACLCCYFIISCNAYSLAVKVYDQDKASLQRGAAVFMNYCSGCHSLSYIRYEQMAQGIGIDNKIMLKNNLIFTQASSSDPIGSALAPADAQHWFGVHPPDLSLAARQRGAAWLYQYLTGFYTDKTRPFGVNNKMMPNAAMPDVLESLKKPIHQAPEEFERTIMDLVNFLAYVAEPTKLQRVHLGTYVLLFLLLLLLPVYCLKRMYWQRIK